MFTLVVQTGKYAGRKIRLAPGDFVIGRDDTAHMQIASAEISRLHCQLSITPACVMVHDLKSRNGTFVDGIPVDVPVRMRPGSKLTVGPMSFRLDGDKPSPSQAKAPQGILSNAPIRSDLSDDEIASMLTDEMPTQALSDTTVGADTVTGPLFGNSVPRTKPIKKVSHSVAEEAREIIRLHLESLSSAGGADS